VTTPPEDRFWPKVEKTIDCWTWIGGKSSAGYGMFWDGTRRVFAHRYAYELLIGPIPNGLQMDHLCRVRACVNPAHLEPVTQRVNILRGEGFHKFQLAKTCCPKGHTYTPENTYVWKNTRRCRECTRAYQRELYHRKKAEARG
jgi:HNH endonuclease